MWSASVFAAAALAVWLAPSVAAAQPAVSGVVVAGVDQDVTAMGRLHGGGLWSFGRIAPEAHLGFDAFLRLDSERGVAARSLTLLDLGVRYGIHSDRFVGPYVSAGGSFGVFLGNPKERKRAGDVDTCATVPNTDDCTYKIDRNLSAHVGFGWGFPSGNSTTVAVRFDITYWAFSLVDIEGQPVGAPIPADVPRPQGAWSALLGFEFMRWR